MTEYIEREALIKLAQSKHYAVSSIDSPFDAVRRQGKLFREAVDECPAVDVVEVVRCRDCKHWNAAVDLCKWFDCCTEADGFCHHGKLKGEEP